MAYIGREPLGGEVILLNSIESQFNGVLTTFNLTRTVSGVTSGFYPVGSQQLLVSLGGVIQRPDPTGDTGFRISFNTIIFAVAPPAGTSCFIVAYGNVTDIGAPANNTVTTDKLVDGSVTPVKLSTGAPTWTSGGTVTVSGDLNVTGSFNSGTQGLFWQDNEIANFGNSNDLQIYHDGVDSYIRDVGTGNLNIYADNEVTIRNASGNEYKARFITDGAVELYFNGSKKFETNSDGIFVSGTARVPNATAFTSSDSGGTERWLMYMSGGVSPSSGNKLIIGNPLNDDVILFTNNTERLRVTGTGNVGIGITNPGAKLVVNGSGNLIRLGDGTNTFDVRFQGPNNWATQLDTTADIFNISRNSVSLVTVRSDGNLGIGTTNPSERLDIWASSGSAGVRAYAPTGNAAFYEASGSNNTVRARLQSSGTDAWIGTITNHDFWISTNNSEKVRVLANGNVGIGTTNPSFGKLDIAGATENQIRINNTNESGHGTVNAKIVAGGSFYQTMNFHAANFVFQTYNGSAIGERIKITSAGDLHSVWNDGRFLGSYYDANYYMGFTFGANNRELYIDNKSSDTRADIVFRTLEGAGTPVERLRIRSNGNVGIGTTNPSVSLDVRGTISTTDGLVNVLRGDITYPRISIFPNGTASDIVGDVLISGYYPIVFRTDLGQERMRISRDGNVGIGITNPSTKLAVNGTITESTNGTNYWPVVTQQDIGTAPNQVPVNGYLGSLAYEDIDSVVLPSLTVTGRSVFSGTGTVNSSVSQNEYAYYFDLAPSKNTWIDATDAVNNVKSHALYVRTPVLDGTNVHGIILAEGGGQASGRNSITFLNEDLNGGTGYTKARLYTEVGPSYQATTFYIDVADASRNLQTRFSINQVGDVVVNNGNLVVSNGKGISFGPTADGPGATSELLDDYEEGTWTPSVGGNATYTTQAGSYVKIGRLVYLNFDLRIGTLGTGSSQYIIPSSLPFVFAGFGGNARAAGSINWFNNLAISRTAFYLEMDQNGMYIGSSNGSSNTINETGVFGNSSGIMGSICYETTA